MDESLGGNVRTFSFRMAGGLFHFSNDGAFGNGDVEEIRANPGRLWDSMLAGDPEKARARANKGNIRRRIYQCHNFSFVESRLKTVVEAVRLHIGDQHLSEIALLSALARAACILYQREIDQIDLRDKETIILWFCDIVPEIADMSIQELVKIGVLLAGHLQNVRVVNNPPIQDEEEQGGAENEEPWNIFVDSNRE
jgi:hypothetical protein